MAQLTVPELDFSPLAKLGETYKNAQKQATLAQLGKGLADGSIDYKQAGATLASLGDIGTGISLMKLGDESKAGAEFANTIGGMYGGGSPAVPVQSPLTPQSPPSQVAPQSGVQNNYSNAISSIESGGKYDLLGPVTKKGDRAYGKYQVMGDNVGPWTKEVLGKEMTPQEFLANPDAQETVFNAKFNSYVNKYGPEGASKAWFAGEKGMNDPSRHDQLGTTVSSYANQFNRQLGGQQVASLGNGMPAPDTRTPPAGPQVAQASPAQTVVPALVQNPATNKIGQLLGASLNPRLPAAQKEVVKTLLTHELKASELTSDQKEYLGAVAQGEKSSFTDWMRANKGAGATKITIDQKGEAKFEEEFGKKQADRWGKYIDNADTATRKLVDINNMRELSQRIGSQGQGANVKEALGPYAEALGINVDGLSDLQAYSQIIQRLAPQQRAPGSGSTSDIEFKGFVKSLPAAAQNPEAREMGLNTMEAISRDDIARGEIATRLGTKEISRNQAEKELRALPDPMKGFVEWRKANPSLYGQLLKSSTSVTAPAQQTTTKPAQSSQPANIPDTVRQNGHTYQKQPDGTMKAID